TGTDGVTGPTGHTGPSVIGNNAIFIPATGNVSTSGLTNVPFTEHLNNGIGITLQSAPNNTNINLQPNSLYYVACSLRVTYAPGTADMDVAELEIKINNNGKLSDVRVYAAPGSPISPNALTLNASGFIQTSAGTQTLTVGAFIKSSTSFTQMAWNTGMSELSIMQIM
ncbi:hypothetical protein CN916_31835, partial [Bacillus thuringiensis]